MRALKYFTLIVSSIPITASCSRKKETYWCHLVERVSGLQPGESPFDKNIVSSNIKSDLIESWRVVSTLDVTKDLKTIDKTLKTLIGSEPSKRVPLISYRDAVVLDCSNCLNYPKLLAFSSDGKHIRISYTRRVLKDTYEVDFSNVEFKEIDDMTTNAVVFINNENIYKKLRVFFKMN